MPQTRTRLTEAQLGVIASPPEGISVAELARQVGAPYATVADALHRIERGWASAVVAAACLVCGGPLLQAAARGRRTVHPGCRRVRNAILRRAYRPRRPDGATAGSRSGRQASPEIAAAQRARARERWARQPATERAEQWQRAHRADARDTTLTRQHAASNGGAWSAGEDAYVLAHLQEPAREVALQLGRTLWAVRNRRFVLRRRA